MSKEYFSMDELAEMVEESLEEINKELETLDKLDKEVLDIKNRISKLEKETQWLK